MNLLVLTPLVPYPPHDGDKLRLYHFLKHLRSKGHVIDLFAVTRAADDLRYEADLRGLCRSVHLERITGQDLFLNLLGGALIGRSLNVSSHFSPTLRDRLKDYWNTQEGRSVDAVLAHRLRMAPAAFEGNPGKPVVLDLTDCLASYTDQVKDQAGFPLSRRLVAWWDHWFIKREEADWGEQAVKTLVISQADAAALRENWLWGDKIEVVPNGVKTDPRTKTPRPKTYGPGRPVVCFVGNMGYPANEDGALWFLREVWPKVRAACPQALFAAVGGHPRRALRQRSNGDDILVTGFVPQVEPYLLNADVSIAPLRVASGMQNKVAQSLALGVPVVATPQALAWAPDKVRECVGLGLDGDWFAREVLEVLGNGQKAKARALKGKRIIRKSYRWEMAGTKLEGILKEAARGGRR